MVPSCPLISAALGILLAVLTLTVGFIPACLLVLLGLNLVVGNQLWGTADTARAIPGVPLRLLYFWLRGCAICLSQCGFAVNCVAAQILDKGATRCAQTEHVATEVAERHVGGYNPPHARGRSLTATAPAPAVCEAPAVLPAAETETSSETGTVVNSETREQVQSPALRRRRTQTQTDTSGAEAAGTDGAAAVSP